MLPMTCPELGPGRRRAKGTRWTWAVTDYSLRALCTAVLAPCCSCMPVERAVAACTGRGSCIRFADRNSNHMPMQCCCSPSSHIRSKLPSCS
jgi:hypothetical protein